MGKNLSAGRHSISFGELEISPGVYVAVLSTESRFYFQKFIGMNGRAQGLGSLQTGLKNASSLSKKSQLEDTLKVDCEGLGPLNVPVDSYDKNLGSLTVRPYNVLFIAIDDLNDWVGFLGGHPQAKTPHMDKLANRGVNFTNAHCPAPGCSPSRNAIMFGVEPHNSGLYPFYNITNVEQEVLEPYTALPLLYRNSGYETYGINKVFHNPDNEYKQDVIWTEYSKFGTGNLTLIEGDNYYIPEPYNKRTVAAPSKEPKTQHGDYKAAQHAAKILEQDHTKPFFLAVGFIKPHSSFIVPEENFKRFSDPILEPEIKADDLSDIPLVGQSNAQIYVEHEARSKKVWEKIRRAYMASTSFTDDNVGLVIDALEKSKYKENTLIVLWSDHGYHLGEKRSFSKFSLWNEATRTPFIIYDPKGRKAHGKEVLQAVGLIDIYHTLTQLTGLGAPAYLDGMSLVPWLDNPERPKERPAMTTWGRGNYTLRTKEWRYTRYHDGTEELYDEVNDFNEWDNLAASPEFNSIKQSFANWLPKNEAPQGGVRQGAL